MKNKEREMIEKFKSLVNLTTYNPRCKKQLNNKTSLCSQFDWIDTFVIKVKGFKEKSKNSLSVQENKDFDMLIKLLKDMKPLKDNQLSLPSAESIQILFESIDSFYGKDKKKIRSLLFALYLVYLEKGNSISNFCENDCSIMGALSNYCVTIASDISKVDDAVLCIELFVVSVKKLKDIDFLKCFFIQFIIPLIARFGVINAESILNLLKSMLCIDHWLVRYSIKIIDKYFSKQTVAIQSNTGEFLSKFARTIAESEVDCLIDDVTNLVKSGLSSQNYQVIDLFLDGILYGCYFCFIKKNSKLFIESTFEAIYRASKKFWKADQRIKAMEALKLLIKSNAEAFENCLIKYNKEKYVAKKAIEKQKEL